MSLDKVLARLKKLEAKYILDVERAEIEQNSAVAHLREVSEQLAQTRDAIAALEGKPTQLKQMLENALAAQKGEPLDSAVGAITPDAAALPSDLPPAEPGFEWISCWNHLFNKAEWVLVPINPQSGHEEIAAQPIVLPAIDPEAEFTDTPESLI